MRRCYFSSVAGPYDDDTGVHRRRRHSTHCSLADFSPVVGIHAALGASLAQDLLSGADGDGGCLEVGTGYSPEDQACRSRFCCHGELDLDLYNLHGCR